MPPVLGVLLAGGQSRRMGGGDKYFRDLHGESILTRVIRKADTQVDHLIINANGDPSRFDDYKLPVVCDSIEGHQGPLAGILTGLQWAAENMPNVKLVVTFPADAPFFPDNLVVKLKEALNNGPFDIACAKSGDRTHPVFALWPVRLMQDLQHALSVEEIRKIDLWTSRYRVVHVEFPVEPVDPFFNINRPEDMDEALKIGATRAK